MERAQQQSSTDNSLKANGQTVLISGASFAGLVAAWWMNRAGYKVTVVEMAPDLRRNGVPADIKAGALDVIRRMGLLERVKAHSLPPRPMIVLDETGKPLRQEREAEPDLGEEYEIERKDLLDLLYDEVKEHVEFVFSDSVATLEERAEQVDVTFVSGRKQDFSLVFGCDGSHSTVRRLAFGEEGSFLKFLKNYFSLTIVPKLLIQENTSQMFCLIGKSVVLNAYNGKTDIIFSFASAEEISYDRKNQDEQKRMILRCFGGGNWRIPELLDEMNRSETAYFDKYCQVQMQSWTKGRFALAGDAAYAPSPAGGNGCTLAVSGSGALGEAFLNHPNDFNAAFREYNESFHPVVARIQAQAVELWLETMVPSSEEDIQKRNQRFGLTRN